MFLGAYWGIRRETRTECALRISTALTAMTKHHSALGSWYRKGRTKSAAIKNQLDVSAESLGEILKTNRRDADGSEISELGFSIGLWNGSDVLPVSFSATCGACTKYVKNSVMLELPADINVGAEESLRPQQVRELLADIIAAFDPDTAVVTSHEYIDRAGGGAPWEAGGWLVYQRGLGMDHIVERGNIGDL